MYSISCNRCSIIFKHLISGISKRNYQSERVFGYRKRTKESYQVNEDVLKLRNANGNFYRLVSAYRQHGHKIANINPIALSNPISVPDLDPSYYGLNWTDNINFTNIINTDKTNGTVQEAADLLNEIYCKHVGAEFTYLEAYEELEWFSETYEKTMQEKLSDEIKIKLASDLLKSQTFDQFMASKFVSVKRYGGEGAEAMMAFFREFFTLSAQAKVEDIVIGMPHRGRLNFLTGFLNFPPIKIFAKLKGKPDFPTKFEATGDVLSHFISSVDIHVDNRPLHVSVLYNPSHLEAVNPVSMGKARAKHLSRRSGDYNSPDGWGDKIINLQVHGDAAFSGQGVNQECLSLSNVPHFEIGGSIHLVVNNQVGFTTPSDRGRASRYCTDLAKIISAPVLHVNGDDPEMVYRVTKIAFEYQRKFRKDVFIDLNCYRQWGHNEMDDPTFTNPAIYKIINSRKTVPDSYAAQLIDEGVWNKEDAEKVILDHKTYLNDELKKVDEFEADDPCFTRQWQGYDQAKDVVTKWNTGVDIDLLTHIGTKSVNFPDNFTIHPHLLKHHVTQRLQKLFHGHGIDWSTAEALAIGSLLHQGYNARISGQDVGRGTFSQRHAMLVDQITNNTYIPLNDIDPNQTGFLEIANSILSEEAVVGFEYGMSIENPNNLVIWEAQFGDFFNGAQIMFDTFISSGETKWLWSSGIVILLPHGYDGAGPEHSSSRIERFLQMTDSKENKPDGDNVNMQVCQPSTPAQYFHLLRRQMIRNFRKPLVVISPKTLLRSPAATSTLSEMSPNTSFVPVIGDSMCNPEKVTKILFTSGKHYYTLLEKRQSLQATDTAIIRIESFCPFPLMELQNELAKYKKVKGFAWCQEEPLNMGAWNFIQARFQNLLGYPITYCGRRTMACPAVGVGLWHQQQAADITVKPFLLKY